MPTTSPMVRTLITTANYTVLELGLQTNSNPESTLRRLAILQFPTTISGSRERELVLPPTAGKTQQTVPDAYLELESSKKTRDIFIYCLWAPTRIARQKSIMHATRSWRAAGSPAPSYLAAFQGRLLSEWRATALHFAVASHDCTSILEWTRGSSSYRKNSTLMPVLYSVAIVGMSVGVLR